jgi:hypothetical protein
MFRYSVFFLLFLICNTLEVVAIPESNFKNSEHQEIVLESISEQHQVSDFYPESFNLIDKISPNAPLQTDLSLRKRRMSKVPGHFSYSLRSCESFHDFVFSYSLHSEILITIQHCLILSTELRV